MLTGMLAGSSAKPGATKAAQTKRRPAPRTLFGRGLPGIHVAFCFAEIERDGLDLAGEDFLDARLADGIGELRVAHQDAGAQLRDRRIGERRPVARAQALIVDADDAMHHMAELVVIDFLAGDADATVETGPA